MIALFFPSRLPVPWEGQCFIFFSPHFFPIPNIEMVLTNIIDLNTSFLLDSSFCWEPPVESWFCRRRSFNFKTLKILIKKILFIFGCTGSLLQYTGFSLQVFLLQTQALDHSDFRCYTARGLSSSGARTFRSPACGIFQNQRSNACPLHWQAGS